MRTMQDKIVLITGAGSGIGRAIAVEVASRKGIPVLLDVNEKGIEETAALIAGKGGSCERYSLDIRDAAQWAGVTGKVLAKFGHVDVLINNAGVFSRAESFLDIDAEQAKFIFDVNMWGAFNGTRALIPHLCKRPEAALVNVSSSLALCGAPMYAIYCASKGAVDSFTYSVRQDMRGSNVNVMMVYPGPTKTNLGRNAPGNDQAKHDADVKFFEQFAKTLPEQVGRKVVNGILANKKMVCTSVDSIASKIMGRYMPITGHNLMEFAFRKLDAKLFARIDAVKNQSRS